MLELPQNVEQEIAVLEQALAEKRAALERAKAEGTIEVVPHEKEILREAVREKISATPGIATPRPPPPSSQPTVVPPSYLTDELKPKVEELVKIALEKSIEEAIKLAKAAENAALLDAFHDIMVDELYSHLVSRGKLKEVV